MTCHAHLGREWRLETALDMLRVLERDVGRWGVRDVEFEVLVGGEVVVFCRVWMDIWKGELGSVSDVE